MLWIAPSEKDTDISALEMRLWAATDRFNFVLANPSLMGNPLFDAARFARSWNLIIRRSTHEKL